MTKQILVTGGPTREPIDPVRFITNFSTGETGGRIAEEGIRRGYEVHLVYGPGSYQVGKSVPRTDIESTKDLLEEVLERVGDYDVFVSAAAVLDYSPRPSWKKIKSDKERINLELTRNPKVLEEVRKVAPDLIFVTFKLEYSVSKEHLFEEAKKLGGDLIVANDLKEITENQHKATILYKDQKFRVTTKQEIAEKIYDLLEENFF